MRGISDGAITSYRLFVGTNVSYTEETNLEFVIIIAVHGMATSTEARRFQLVCSLYSLSSLRSEQHGVEAGDLHFEA